MANRFLDRSLTDGNLTGTWTFTNASADVVSVGGSGDAINDGLVAGDFIKSTAKNEWYPVASVIDKDNLILEYNYVDATEVGSTCSWSDVSDNDGTTTAKAFCHPNQYTTREARAAGDVLYMRRGQTHLIQAIAVSFDEDGTYASTIGFIGDDGTGWAGETGLAQPIFDFNGSGVAQFVYGKTFWNFEDFEVHDSHHSYGCFSYYSGSWSYFKDVKFTEGISGFGNFFMWPGHYSVFEDCSFEDGGLGLRTYSNTCYAKFYRCNFDNNTNGYMIGAGDHDNEFIECDWGVTSINTGSDIVFQGGYPHNIKFRDCRFDSTTFISGRTNLTNGASIFFMDIDDTKNINQAYYGEGTVIRNTVDARGGGADTCLECEPTARCDDYTEWPFICYETWIYNAGALATYTVYMTADEVWAALPTAGQLYLEALYFDDADAGRTTVVSNDVIAVEGTWKAFDVTCTPNAAGPVRLRVYLTKFEADKEILIDPLVVVS